MVNDYSTWIIIIITIAVTIIIIIIKIRSWWKEKNKKINGEKCKS